jgi:plastocyanin
MFRRSSQASVRQIMSTNRRFASSNSALILMTVALCTSGTAQSKANQYACSAAKPAQQCTAANTCGSATTPCSVDVKRTASAASSTPDIPNAKGNALFCVKAGTTVQWKSTGKEIGFVVDLGPASPFSPGGAIMGGSDHFVSVVAKTPGCYKYSAGACRSGAVYGMCGQTNAQLVVTP